jgi:hypothetical protein
MNRYARSFTAGLSDGDKLEFEYEVIITAGNSEKARGNRELFIHPRGWTRLINSLLGFWVRTRRLETCTTKRYGEMVSGMAENLKR